MTKVLRQLRRNKFVTRQPSACPRHSSPSYVTLRRTFTTSVYDVRVYDTFTTVFTSNIRYDVTYLRRLITLRRKYDFVKRRYVVKRYVTLRQICFCYVEPWSQPLP